MTSTKERVSDADKIADIINVIEHLNSCIKDLSHGIGCSKAVIIGAARDEVNYWDY